MKKLFTLTLAAIMILSVMILPVSAAEYEYLYHPPYEGELEGSYTYWDDIHESCAPSLYGAFTFLKINKNTLESTVGRELPSTEADKVHAIYSSGGEYLTQWCSCRFCKEFNGEALIMFYDSEIRDKLYENNGETAGFYSLNGTTWVRNSETYEVPMHFFLINSLGIDREWYDGFNNDKRENGAYDYIAENTSYDEVYTDEELDALFSGDKDLVVNTLKCPFAYYYNGKIYSQDLIIQTLYNQYFMSGEMEFQKSHSQYNYLEKDNYNELNESFDEVIGGMVYEGGLFEYLVEQQAYYKKNPVGYNEYLLEALIIKLSEDYPDVEIPEAPKTGTLTAVLALVSLISGAYVVTKKRR